jgi:hypothetical protein
VLVACVRRRSGEGIVYSAIDVKKWAEREPSAEQARPSRCSRCGAASRPPGKAVVVVSHGLRERQIRGPAAPGTLPETRVVQVRRYRCRCCGGLTTVLPRGLTARRHYSASAIGLALCLHGMRGLSVGATRRRVCTWPMGFETERWTTLCDWANAIDEGRLFPRVRPLPEGGASLRRRAERAASSLCGMALGSASLEEQVFQGAALAARGTWLADRSANPVHRVESLL